MNKIAMYWHNRHNDSDVQKQRTKNKVIYKELPFYTLDHVKQYEIP